jgi:hypothetical protein
MSEASHRELMYAERNRTRAQWVMRTPLGAVEFLNSLVNEVAAHWGVTTGVHVYPDGTLGGRSDEPRHIFMEPDVLNMSGLKIERVELGSNTKTKKKTCDLVVATLPMGGPPGGRNRPDEMIDRLVSSGQLLSQVGVGVLLTSSFYRTFTLGQLAERLSAIGVHVHGLVNTPPRFLLPYASIQPVFVIVSRRSTSNAFALDCRNFEDMALNIPNALGHVDTGDLRAGIEVDLSEFKGFEHWYAQREISSLEGDYAKYGKCSLQDVSLFINFARRGEDFVDEPDSVYLPLFGNGPAVDSLLRTTMNHQYYAQIVVDTSKAVPEFLCSFLNTKYVRLILEAEKLTRSQHQPRLNREQVRLLPLALPDIDTQLMISKNIQKLSELRSLVDDLAQNISINPVSSTSMTPQLDDALAVFGKLSAADQVLALVRDGESRLVEFKASFSLPIEANKSRQIEAPRNSRPESDAKQLRERLETSSLKTIVAFLNSDGGDLLIGVKDDRSINGLNDEIKQLRGNNHDKFLLYFVTKVKERIGAGWIPYINHSLIEAGGKLVLRVHCEPSQDPAYLDKDVFYIRTNPATEPLKGPDVNDYIRRRFPLPTAVLG